MPPPEYWFVYDRTEGEFNTYLSEAEAQAAYDKLITDINTKVGEGEYEGDEMIEMGRIHKRAEVVPVGIFEGTEEEYFLLVSYNLINEGE